MATWQPKPSLLLRIAQFPLTRLVVLGAGLYLLLGVKNGFRAQFASAPRLALAVVAAMSSCHSGSASQGRRDFQSNVNILMKVTNTAHMAVGIAVLLLTGLAGATPFDKNHVWQKISFHITSPNSAAGNTLRIVPAGLQIDNSPIEMNIDGVVTGTDVADLNSDRSPEVYIYVRQPGAANRLSLVAFSANNRKSLSGVHLPELDEARAAGKGYCGNDQMAVVKGKFVRRFSLCDDQGQATGKTRQIEYKLQPGEAGWQLNLHSAKTVVE